MASIRLPLKGMTSTKRNAQGDREAAIPELLCNFIETALRHGCSPVNFLHIFRTPFPKNTSGGLLLKTNLFKFNITLKNTDLYTVPYFYCASAIFSFP